MRRFADLLLPLLPVSTLITSAREPMTGKDVAINAVFIGILVFLWLTLRD
jgi:hypothetical protein